MTGQGSVQGAGGERIDTRGTPESMGRAPRDSRWRRAGVVALLWFGVLAAPAAFMLDLGASFALVEKSCETGRGWLLWATTAFGALVAVAALWRSAASFRAVGRDPHPRGEGVEESSPRSTGHTLSSEYRTDAAGPVGRSRFMAMAGVAVSGFFLLVMLAAIVPKLVLGPCS